MPGTLWQVPCSAVPESHYKGRIAALCAPCLSCVPQCDSDAMSSACLSVDVMCCLISAWLCPD